MPDVLQELGDRMYRQAPLDSGLDVLQELVGRMY